MNDVTIGVLLGILIPLAAPFIARQFGYRLSNAVALLLGVAGLLLGFTLGINSGIRRAVHDPRLEVVHLGPQTYQMTRGTRLCLLINAERRLPGLPDPAALRDIRVERPGGRDLTSDRAFLTDTLSRMQCPRQAPVTRVPADAQP